MFLSVDIGGTNTRIASSRDLKKIDQKKRYPTPDIYDEGLDRLVEAVEDITKGDMPKMITVAVPSPIDHIKGSMTRPPNLPKWKDHSIRQELEHMLHTKILLEHDAALAGLSESFEPGRKKYQVIAYITLSTGLGGVRIVNQKIDIKGSDFEPGHQILEQNGRFWPGCGQRGCFEALCSGKAFEITYGIKPEFCEDYKIWEEHAELTSQGLVNTITLWAPDLLVIGGSLIKAGKKFTEPLIKFTQKKLQIFECPKIEISKLGDDNVLMGGLILQKQKYS